MTTTTAQSKTMIEHKGQLVNTAHVESLISTYKKERWIQNSERLGKNDSLSTWYGLPELEAFIQKAKDHNADGIKMYFGVYPNNYRKVEEYQGRQTIVLVATKSNQNDNGILNKDVYIKTNDKLELLAFNAGYLCPPFCNNLSKKSYMREIEVEKIGTTILEKEQRIIII